MHKLPILMTKEVSKMFNIPMRTIKYYTELSLVNLANHNPGIGNSRRYSIHDMINILLAFKLDNLGVKPPVLALKAEQLNLGISKYLENPKTASRYMFIWITSDMETKVSWHTSTNFPYSASILMDLASLHHEVERTLSAGMVT